MNIPQDIADLIVDQLISVVSDSLRQECLRSLSLVSTVWVDRCQHYLFSTITLSHEFLVKKWFSRTRDGVSKHVRALFLNRADFYWSFLVASDIQNPLHILTSFQNLRELGVHDLYRDLPSLDVLTPIFSSFANSLRRLTWSPGRTPWTTVTALIDLLPNLADLELAYYSPRRTKQITSPPLPRIQLTYNVELADSLKFKHFKFQELSVHTLSFFRSQSLLEYCRTHLRALDLRNMQISYNQDCGPLRALLGACSMLEVVAFTFGKGFGQLMASISSDSISLIHVLIPRPSIPSEISQSFCSWPVVQFENYFLELERTTLPECRELGASLLEIGRRFSDRHPGSETRVRISPWLTDAEAQVIEDVDIPFFQAEIEQVTGSWVTFELAPSTMYFSDLN